MAYPIGIEFIWSLELSVGYWVLKYMHIGLYFQNNFMALRQAHRKNLIKALY
jgi:hypothetical protein